MRKLLFASVLLFFVTGCAVMPDRTEIVGPKALIKDFVGVEPEEHPGTPMFYVSKIDGKEIYNSEGATRQRTRGKGLSIDTEIVERYVPAKKMRLTLVARNVHAAPIQEIFHSMRGKSYKVEGAVDFEPKPDGVYLVTGTIGPGGTAVWLQDEKTKEAVTEKIVAPQNK